MNFTDRISNQTTIYYSQGKYNRQQTNRLSSPNLRSPKNHKHGKESTKEWVAGSFYSEPTRGERNFASTVKVVKPSAANANDHANASAGYSGKDYTDTNKNSYQGKPAVFFQKSIIDSQAEKFKYCLVGKFARWRPSLSRIKDWAATNWKLSGNSSISLLDHRHVFIRLDNEADMLHVWTRNRWFIGGHMVRVFKWSPTFVPSNGEPPSAAIWVSFPSLPLAFFQEELLFPIAALAGKVLAMDDPTRNFTRTNVARVCIEVDLLKELPRRVWIGVGEGGFWQDLYYWRLPTYCSNCREQGHSIQLCQANGSDSLSRATKSKKNLNSAINKGKCSNVYSGQRKRARAFPIIEQDEGSREPMRLGSSQPSMEKDKHKEIAGCKGESISHDSSKDLSSGDGEKNMYTEATEHRGECSHAPNIERTLSAWNSNGMTNQGINVTGKSEFSETVAEARDKGVDRRSEEEGESFGQVVRKSPPRRQIISSKMLNFLWRRKPKDRSPNTQLSFAGNMSRVRTESEFGSAFPLCSHVSTSLSRLTKFQYSEIVKMTGSFRVVLGHGGYGTVFKGILPDGQEVALKALTQPHPRFQGEYEFHKEIQILRNTQHANIIRLLGFCLEGRNRILVYELMASSLADIIHSEESSSFCSFCSKHSKEVMQIAIGIARGVEYLHYGFDPPILHLDIKPHNILLDKELRPKLADFGISSAYTCSSHCDTIVRGTPGYLDPVFYSLGRVSRSTDVYSYGITLLEMALRRKPINIHEESSNDKYILPWVRRRVTPMGGIRDMALDEIQRKMVIVGIWCTQDDPVLRPLFPSIINMLEGSLDCLSLPASSTEEKVDNRNEFSSDDHPISDALLTGGTPSALMP